MKGTFFSADFIKDANGTPRLLELNTDTTLTASGLAAISFTPLLQVLQTNSIEELHIIYKDMHKDVVAALQAELELSALNVNVVLQLEGIDTVYPTAVADATNKFILRMAYDESAIFDSTYTKVDFNTLKLFADADQSSKVVEAFHSSSYGTIDTLTNELVNGSTVPDFAAKPIIPSPVSIQFLKLAGSGEAAAKIAALKSEAIASQRVLTRYYPTPGTKAKTIRSTNILYGPNLDILFLGEFESSATFEYPASLTVNTSAAYTPLSPKHYFEFATNPVSDREGILPSAKILLEDGTAVAISDIEVTNVVDSFHVSGSPGGDFESANIWEYSGSELPSGSHNISAVVYDIESGTSNSTILHKVTFTDGSSLEAAGLQRALTYIAAKNVIKYQTLSSLKMGDKIFTRDGSKKEISAHSVIVVDQDTPLTFNTINVEESDNYILSGSNVIVHNAPCFIAGTKISTPEGDVNIEDIKEGDTVYSFNFETKSVVEAKVLVATVKEDRGVITLTIDTPQGESTITCTEDHPFFVQGKGWSSYDSDLLRELSGMAAEELLIGDKIQHIDGGFYELVSFDLVEKPATVYNLDNVETHNNFYANQALVHNRLNKL